MAVNKIKKSRYDKYFDIVINCLSVILLLIFAYPLYYMIIASFSSTSAVWNGDVKILPVGFSFDGYHELLKHSEIWRGYLNSIIITALGVFINLTMTTLGAYVLSSREFMPRNFFMKLITFTMFFSGGLIPLYLMVNSLGMIDTLWSLVIPGAVNVQNLIIMRTFFQNSIPYELKEAAFLDGISHSGYLVKIVLPLSKAIFAVMALYYGVAHWNGYFNAMIYLNTESKFPLQLILRQILLKATTLNDSSGDSSLIAKQVEFAEIIKYCAIIVASIPALIAYPFIQKYFVKGVMIGSIKG